MTRTIHLFLVLILPQLPFWICAFMAKIRGEIGDTLPEGWTPFYGFTIIFGVLYLLYFFAFIFIGGVK